MPERARGLSRRVARDPPLLLGAPTTLGLSSESGPILRHAEPSSLVRGVLSPRGLLSAFLRLSLAVLGISRGHVAFLGPVLSFARKSNPPQGRTLSKGREIRSDENRVVASADRNKNHGQRRCEAAMGTEPKAAYRVIPVKEGGSRSRWPRRVLSLTLFWLQD